MSVCLSVYLSVCMLPMASRRAGPIKTKLGIGTHVDQGSVFVKVKVKVKVIWRHLVNANKTHYRGPQGPREFKRKARYIVPAGGRVLTASISLIQWLMITDECWLNLLVIHQAYMKISGRPAHFAVVDFISPCYIGDH